MEVQYKPIMADVPQPPGRLKWTGRMIAELVLYDPDRWTTARVVPDGDPLSCQLRMDCRRPVEDRVWVHLKNIIRSWAEQNDCVAKDIRRYKTHIEVDLLLKYLGRESDFNPTEPLPLGERLWRKGNKK